jgi:hypothetical protein
VYDASSMHCTDIFATAAKAATNIVPVPYPPQHYIKTVHADDAFLPWRRQKVLGGGENSLVVGHLELYRTHVLSYSTYVLLYSTMVLFGAPD